MIKRVGDSRLGGKRGRRREIPATVDTIILFVYKITGERHNAKTVLSDRDRLI